MGKYLNSFSSQVKATNKNYQREIYQTYFTAPEWRNVDMSDEFAAFLENKNAFYRYPFFSQVKIFWLVFHNSFKAGKAKSSSSSVFFSAYMLMNLFIGITTSLEFIAKGLVSLLFRPFLKKKNDSDFQKCLADVFRDYADFIHHTPFYNFKYFTSLKTLYKGFVRSKNKTIADFVSLITVTFDFIAHGIISAPIGYWYNQEANKEPEVIDVLVKKKTDANVCEQEFKDELQKEVEATQGASIVDEHIYSRTNENKHRTYAYAHLRIQRYEPFKKILTNFADQKINVREIAGQQDLHIKCEIRGNNPKDIEDKAAKLSNIEGCSKLFSYKNMLDDNLTFFSLNVETRHLDQSLRAIKEVDGVTIKLMHDF